MTKNILFIIIFTVLLVVAIYLVTAIDLLLLDLVPWLLIFSTLIGIVLGILRSRYKNKPLIENGYVARHCFGAFVQHWVTTLGILLLIISGFFLGFLFIPHFADTPKTVLFPLNLHFMGLIITTFGGFYFLSDYLLSKKLSVLIPNFKDIANCTISKYILRKKLDGEGKYLSSQKSAFLIFAILGGVQLITGAIKIAAHFLSIPPLTLAISTLTHDIFSLFIIIMLIVHILFAVSTSSHRLLLKAWFTGKITEKFIKEKHVVWYEELRKSMENINAKL